MTCRHSKTARLRRSAGQGSCSAKLQEIRDFANSLQYCRTPSATWSDKHDPYLAKLQKICNFAEIVADMYSLKLRRSAERGSRPAILQKIFLRIVPAKSRMDCSTSPIAAGVTQDTRILLRLIFALTDTEPRCLPLMASDQCLSPAMGDEEKTVRRGRRLSIPCPWSQSFGPPPKPF